MDEKLQTVTITHAGKPITVSVHAQRYAHGGRLVVQLIDEADGQDYATVSVNVFGVSLADDEFVFKNYSENEGLLEALLAANVVELTGRSDNIGPICRLLRK